MRQWLRKLVQGLVLGALLALLFLYPQAAMQGVREGLSLCAKIAARHSASLSVKSSPGKGTVVTVSLHCQETAGEKGAAE